MVMNVVNLTSQLTTGVQIRRDPLSGLKCAMETLEICRRMVGNNIALKHEIIVQCSRASALGGQSFGQPHQLYRLQHQRQLAITQDRCTRDDLYVRIDFT